MGARPVPRFLPFLCNGGFAMVAKRVLTAALLAPLFGLCGTPGAFGQDPVKLVNEYLEQRGASGYTIAPITDAYVARTFPETDFLAVWFRQYPVAVQPPEGLAAANVAYVQDREVYFLTDPDDLEGYFFAELGPVANPDETADAGRTWLRLSEEFSQDGFYAFGAPEVKVIPTRSGGFVSGRVKVAEGGKGSLQAHLLFDPLGRLVHVAEKRAIRPGVRPICQATKLLDADPLVRRMAEQDLLVMGRAAKGYLDVQRARARPELRQAIDRVWKRIVDEGW